MKPLRPNLNRSVTRPLMIVSAAVLLGTIFELAPAPSHAEDGINIRAVDTTAKSGPSKTVIPPPAYLVPLLGQMFQNFKPEQYLACPSGEGDSNSTGDRGSNTGGGGGEAECST